MPARILHTLTRVIALNFRFPVHIGTVGRVMEHGNRQCGERPVLPCIQPAISRLKPVGNPARKSEIQKSDRPARRKSRLYTRENLSRAAHGRRKPVPAKFSGVRTRGGGAVGIEIVSTVLPALCARSFQPNWSETSRWCNILQRGFRGLVGACLVSLSYLAFKVFIVLYGSWLFLVLREIFYRAILTFFPAKPVMDHQSRSAGTFRGENGCLFTRS